MILCAILSTKLLTLNFQNYILFTPSFLPKLLEDKTLFLSSNQFLLDKYFNPFRVYYLCVCKLLVLFLYMVPNMLKKTMLNIKQTEKQQ